MAIFLEEKKRSELSLKTEPVKPEVPENPDIELEPVKPEFPVEPTEPVTALVKEEVVQEEVIQEEVTVEAPVKKPVTKKKKAVV